ncbi:Hypothetical predicted protein [Olea europaea subsp. europaea]|uniref:Vacuolar import/degradation Vid27 C-terminal domain-containing protein n=1 Tax=Olea europaea subsp. europaea TaxID=158383 RepID=A0A8S0R2S7_OLEEU|nr:Hypothetical predicted protein [Olea europaea subsp. europaea]
MRKRKTNMMLMSPMKQGKPHSLGLHQLDIKTENIVTEWKFEKYRTEITMKDNTSDAKGSQLDPSESTFLGLNNNKLCQWNSVRNRGMLQKITNPGSPVLHWTQGHEFFRRTNFRCFAITRDGSIIVWSLDGKTKTTLEVPR